MNSIKKIFLSAVFCILTFCSSAKFVFNENCRNAYTSMICLRFEESKKIIAQEKNLNSDNNLVLLCENYVEFLTAFLSEEKKDFELYENNMQRRMSIVKDDESNSPFKLYCEAEFFFQSALIKIKFKEFVAAAYEIQKSFKLLTANQEMYPQFLLNYKNLGMLHAATGAVPENYKWAPKLVGMYGTLPQGISELHYLYAALDTTDYKVFKDEIFVVLALVELNMNNNADGAIELTKDSSINIHKNPLLIYSAANIKMKTGSNEEALQLLNLRPQGSDYFPFHFLDYKTGVAKLNNLDLSASHDFENFLKGFHGMNFIKAAYQKLAWIYLLNDDKEKYKEYINRCIDEGYDLVDEDKDALREAMSSEIPNPVLLRARLYFDGGYYLKSIGEIAGKPISVFPRFKDQLEVSYRMARILHETNKTDKAIEYYLQTLKNGESYVYYFAANSALELGLIYEEQKDFDNAKKYFHQCLSMRKHDYQNSIDQKAKAALARLEKK